MFITGRTHKIDLWHRSSAGIFNSHILATTFYLCKLGGCYSAAVFS
jgi:hypothetical protein